MEQEKRCDICGKTFIARNRRQHVCFRIDCRRAYHNKTSADYRKRNPLNHFDIDCYEPYVAKPDTIVAIGYAERQMAETLKMAGKVKV